MPTPVLDTKLFRPTPRPGLVARPRLDERLAPTAETRLTLVSAPAGFGKTTLLTALVDRVDGPVAWVSLDERDGQAASFWTYVLTALDRAAPGTATDALVVLQTGQVPIEAVLATVLNELTVLPDELHLVLDDYHLADTPDVQQGMTYLLDHLPPQVHLTIGTRADPALPLARLRGRGELVEVRAVDLRMTHEEVATYVGDLGLTDADVSTLESRTEGWVAALQLAALSLRDREDPATFVAEFAGDDRYVVDYLADEVLDQQSPEVRDFLLETSILDRLTGPLCRRVTDDDAAQQVLERLDRQNLFVVPLDANRRTYRYHHLFADVLRARLYAERGTEVAGLHRRAAEGYDDAGDPVPAVRHALAAGDLELAADLMEAALPELQRGRQEHVIAGWSQELPETLVHERPALAIGLVGGLMSSNRFDAIAERLLDIEAALAESGHDPAHVAHVPAQIEMYRAALALISGDLAGTVAHADRATELAGEQDLPRAAAAALSGLASWTAGDLDAAHRGYTVAVEGLLRAGHVADVLGCSITLADLEITLGRPDLAQQTLERALALTEADPGLRGVADMHVGLARLATERGDLDTAREHLRVADAEPEGLPQNPYRWRVAMAAVREAEGDLDGALALLDEAQRVYVGDYSPDVRPIAAHRARVLVAKGELGAARAWAGDRGLAADDELSYLRELEHLTLARLLLAERSPDAVPLLERLLAAAEAGGRAGSVAEIRAAQSGSTPPRRERPSRRPDLIDPLSDRELDVLRYLASDLGGPEIARELVVSLNTVRTHTKHIYTKLEVTNRRSAVTRAHQLGLL